MISTIFAVLLDLVIVGARRLAFHIEASSPYFLVVCLSMVVLLVLVVIHLQVNWALAPVVVVAESTWGSKALDRSWSSIKGRRWLAFSVFVLCGVFWWNICYRFRMVQSDDYCKESERSYIVKPVTLNLLVIVKLYLVAANTALYVIRKAESGGDCIKLAVDRS
ncbi:hypothetical protein TIFTF001_011139 [Ficus carica]|uniref:Uncharacterized protein n=1 Tax=Ficus carica TaxID=3494 RepID=A0AA88D541_FICCA|nr:hypothetical protein TIFTF001_011139 [Ficus carica]